jgi:hypothetical protein
MAQERHAPPHAVLQQTPSVQCADAHSLPARQVAPFIFRPQLPPTHLRPLTQFASLVQVGKHLSVDLSQEKGAHRTDAACLHVPVPSQRKVLVTASVSHLPERQTVPEG